MDKAAGKEGGGLIDLHTKIIQRQTDAKQFKTVDIWKKLIRGKNSGVGGGGVGGESKG